MLSYESLISVEAVWLVGRGGGGGGGRGGGLARAAAAAASADSDSISVSNEISDDAGWGRLGWAGLTFYRPVTDRSI